MSMFNGNLPSIRLLGTRIHALRMSELIALCDVCIRQRRPLHLGVVNAAKLVRMSSDDGLNEAVIDSDLVLADGMSVVWAARFLGRPLPERCAGIDIMLALMELAARNRYRVFCLGATGAVLDQAVTEMRRLFPRIDIAGHHDGYFGPDDEPEVVRQIEASGADMLFVAITSPKKEQFMARWADRLTVPIRHGVGGSFDVLAGKVRRAPRWMQRIGMEWFYRVAQEPGRLWRRYFVTNPVFAWMVLQEFFRRPRASRGCVKGTLRAVSRPVEGTCADTVSDSAGRWARAMIGEVRDLQAS